MKEGRDIAFKIGLGLQLLLIPTVFLYHFGQEANYYNWITSISFIIVVVLFFWPQAIMVRAKRLSAIKLQFVLVAILLALCWPVYLYFHNFVYAHSFMPLYSVQGEVLAGNRWLVVLQPGISLKTAILATIIFIAFPFANLYRYKLDKKRIKGIKKDALFV